MVQRHPRMNIPIKFADECSRSREREVSVVATVLANPTAKLPPNICTALAYAPEYWDSVEAREVAMGIKDAMEWNRPTHKRVVWGYMRAEYRDWLNHPDFNTDLPLPMDLAEYEATSLVQRYAQKRIVNYIANAYQEVLDRPEKARVVALDLKLKLEGVL